MRKLAYLKAALIGGASAIGLASAALADQYNIPSGDLVTALTAYSTQTGVELIVSDDAIKGTRTNGVKGELTAYAALSRILAGTGFTMQRDASGAVGIVRASTASPRELAPVQVSQTQAKAASSIESVLVTAQKKVEDIQLVPIAVTALSEKQLNEMKIEGGPDLLKTIPNVTFSKNNFSGYNFSIRGIGTKAISVTTDPGVAVEFNSTALIRNRLFEQEYFDTERVEILRGPQGTLHGRNATAGVINVISAKPDLGEFFGSIKGEVGNYQSRRGTGMLNIPIVTDKLGVRLAGSYTMRDGYDYNATTHHPVNGRNLWSGRLTVGFQPVARLHGNLVWEHFNENDDRSRTGKQLCHRDPGLSSINGETLNPAYGGAETSQGCKAGSLYDPGAFGTPNGLSIPFVYLAGFIGDPGGSIGYDQAPSTFPYEDRDLHTVTALNHVDPYGGMMQSPDLRVINSFRDPKYRARADVVELNFDFDLTPSLTVTSQTAYDKDQVYSFQDYNRFNTVPVFPNTSSLWDGCDFGMDCSNGLPDTPSRFRNLSPGGIYCDPQLGCSGSIAGFDISQAKSTQFSQEIRLASNWNGPFNFSAGANYTRYKTLEDYYVMYNIITLLSQISGGVFIPLFNNSVDVNKCGQVHGVRGDFNYFAQITDPPVDIGSPEAVGCIYIDPNPVESINGDGHNYFRSKNPYQLSSEAAFGELYYQVSDTLKATLGLRYTDDRKIFTPVPTQVLLSSRIFLGGTVDRGYPADPDIKQHWGKFTGRFNMNWTPKLDFTDQSMFYASYSRGYKGGGANPPGIGFDRNPVDFFGNSVAIVTPADYPAAFKPEFVDAFELGTKNTLLDGSLVLNSDVFFYDYKDYQVSQIKDRTSVNENFGAKVWGMEIESFWQPTSDFRLNANFGYQNSRIDNSARSIDLMDRTAGNSDYMVLKPFVIQPSNCIVPKAVAANAIRLQRERGQEFPDKILLELCPGNFISDFLGPLLFGDPFNGSPITRSEWLATTNNGAGFYKDLGGNQLPNAPHFTFNIGAQYTLHWIKDWDMRVRGDFYHQSSSFARVYNDRPYDRLRGWNNANASLTFERVEDGLSIELYAKNVFDKTAITDAFLNSDDTALTTNVFVTDPRLIGFSITKPF